MLLQFLVVTEGDFFGAGRLPKPAFGQVYLNASWSLSRDTLTADATEVDSQPVASMDTDHEA